MVTIQARDASPRGQSKRFTAAGPDRSPRRPLPWLILAWLILVVPSLHAQITATLDRDTVPAGHGALLSVEVSGKNATKPELPHVKDLIVQTRGTSHAMQMGMGGISQSTTYSYVIGSQTPGGYQIPPITATINGKKFSSQPLHLKVLEADQQPDPEPEPEPEDGCFGFLTVELAANDRNHVYVGEIAPVRIRAWLPPGSKARLNSAIQPEGEAFTLHNLTDRPTQSTEIRDGKRYRVVTWFGGISATKAGQHPASLSIDATVAIPDTNARNRPRDRTGSPFDDPFFDRFFDNTPMIEKQLTLKSEDKQIEVRPLPTKDRPADFHGAVGEFQLSDIEIPATWKTGEPQQIHARISGSGNFSLVDAPSLVPAENWKSYTPKYTFTPEDQASFAGHKDFTFSAVPLKGGSQTATLSFSFFDPDNAEYRTLTSQQNPITATGPDIVENDQSGEPAPPAPEPATNPANQLVAQHDSHGNRGNLVPLVSRPAFPRLLTLATILLLAGPAAAVVRRHRTNPERLARLTARREAENARQAADRCAAANDLPGFITHARLAIQHRLAPDWDQAARAITTSEVLSREPEQSPVPRFFRSADYYEYRSSHETGIPQELRHHFNAAINHLDAR
ncbi:MAG: BatD family protein [Verrucomicrobiota bacterium JB025]|nr:BatD family protein [Verrucomicrobiota bacterium JB025]